jgi:peptidoglycan/LPS O-acetylase OafA/YrhL
MGAGRNSGVLGRLRSAALIAVLVGAAGSVGLVLREGQRSPRFLLVLFVLWVVSPFVGVVLAEVVSKRWPVLGRAPLHGVSLGFTVGSLGIYGAVVLGLFRARPAAVFLLVPLACWVLIAIALVFGGRVEEKAHDHN